MINMTILYLKVNPTRFSLRPNFVVPPATAPRELPFSTITPQFTHGDIPMIIHQSWKNHEVPNRFKRWQKQWWTMHPRWDYHLWTDEDNRELVKQHYPWFLGTYDALPMGIMRADSVRYMYMHHFGGLYADLDMEPLRSTEELLATMNFTNSKNNALLAYMGTNFKFEHNVPNAWMISTPNHPFWLFCLTKIIELLSQGVDSAEDLTGPVMLYKAITDYNEANRRINGVTSPGVVQGANNVYELTILKPGLIYPYDWAQANSELHGICWAKDGVILESTLDEQKCKSMFPHAYAITYWTHSWGL
jgi:mannosyltransferase OCH1-like enzyme